MYNNRTYVIIPFKDVTQSMIDACMQSSLETLRHSNLGADRVVLKYEGETPIELDSYTKFTHAQILAEMETDDWKDVIPAEIQSVLDGL